MNNAWTVKIFNIIIEVENILQVLLTNIYLLLTYLLYTTEWERGEEHTFKCIVL